MLITFNALCLLSVERKIYKYQNQHDSKGQQDPQAQVLLDLNYILVFLRSKGILIQMSFCFFII